MCLFLTKNTILRKIEWTFINILNKNFSKEKRVDKGSFYSQKWENLCQNNKISHY